MKTKKYIFILAAILINVSFSPINAQEKNKLSQAFLMDSSSIIIENNYSQNTDDIKYQPYYIQFPFKDFHYTVYGSRLQISVFNLSRSGLLWNSTMTLIGFITDTTKEDASFFKIQTLEYCIRKNNAPEMNWIPVTAGKAYIDTLIRKPGKTLYRRGLLLYDNDLQNRDTAILSFRKHNGQPFLNIHFQKASALASPPFLMASMDDHNKYTSLEKFIRKALQNYQALNTDFYQDWPGRNDNSNARLFRDTKSAYFFRKREDIANDSAFEYRLIVDNDTSVKWKRSDNIIFVSHIQSGTQYQLQVRYADKPQYVYVKKFHVDKEWYQTVWIKIIAIIFLLLIILLLIYFSKNKKEKRLKTAQKNRIKALYAQLNPHFIFNALGSIQGLLNDSQIESANKYLSGFGSLLRNTLNSGDKDSISLYEEIQNLHTYVMLEQLRQAFRFDVTIDQSIHTKEAIMLPLLFQPVIENAIKHGYKNHNQEFYITLTVKKENDNLIVSIQDNGQGFDTGKQYNGKGIRLIEERIILFNNGSKNKKIKKELSSSPAGTLFILKFINWLRDD